MKFEGVRVFRVNFGDFKRGAALTLPGIGIFVGKGRESDLNLLRHEFGHILQFRKWGFWFFCRYIAGTSLKSARTSQKKYYFHQSTWTEWSANYLSYRYFDKPKDWNFHRFPIAPNKETKLTKPSFAQSNDEFIRDWVEA